MNGTGGFGPPSLQGESGMKVGEFLRTVLPDEGYLIIATPKPKAGTSQTIWWNKVVADIPEAIVQSAQWANEGNNVFFALGSYAEQRVWNPTKIDWKTKKPGAWEKRTQANVKLLKSLYLDLDVKHGKAKANERSKYPSQADAVAALRTFCTTVGLPKPMLVNSGFGLHVYWPFTHAIAPATWKPIAENLKSICVKLGLLADHAVTADEARVLRVPGTLNFKDGTGVPVVVLNSATPHDPAALAAILDKYVVDNDVPQVAPKPSSSLPARQGAPAGIQGNLGATNDPLNGNMVVFSCAAMRKLVSDRGASAGYPTWLLGLSIARHCEDSKLMMRAISDGHPKYNEAETIEKMDSLTTGPSTCLKFWPQDKATCEACPHWNKITSPAQLGRAYRETPPEVKPGEVAIPSPPYPYVRTDSKDGGKHVILRVRNDDDETTDLEVCPYDLYPSRIMDVSTDEDDHDERSAWVYVHPKRGEMQFKMPQTLLSDPRKLHSFLLSRGMHINAKHAKATQFYMTAYLNQLSKVIDREKMYERLGWHEGRKCFVLPDVIYHADGTETPHQASRLLESSTKSAYQVAGDQKKWYELIKFYSGPTYYTSRLHIFASFGAPLFHMTGHKGVLLAASGDTGRGKTTILKTAASVWGNPDPMLVGGGSYGSTINATFAMLGTAHSVPFFWDDTTDREPEEMRNFMLHIPTGKGKDRMHGNVHDGKVVTWETIVMSSTNTDDVHRIMATGANSTPHLMRFVSVPFDPIDSSTEAKLAADQYLRNIQQNYGHAGRIFIKYVVANREKVQAMVERVMEKFDRATTATSEERHWSAFFAAAYVGGRIAYNLGLIPFDPKADLQWMFDHAGDMRVTYKQAVSTSVDILNEYLETHVANTLILSPKQASNVDNIVQKPHSAGGLLIRNEVDTNRIYVARTAFNSYCNDIKANFRSIEAELLAAGVILRKDAYKVLGADTPLAMGQTRCWEIDRVTLSKKVKR